MSVSLRNQTVYATQTSGVWPATSMVFACMCLLLVLSNKIWVKANLVDLGYSLAAAKKNGEILNKEKAELEMIKNLLLQQSTLSEQAEAIGLRQVTASQIVKIK